MSSNDRALEAGPETAAPSPAPLVVAEPTSVVTPRKLTRNDVAALRGVSASTVIRRERQGVLRAELVDGVHVYDETEVRRTITTSRHRSALAVLGGATGDAAALVFKELDAGLNEVEIVKRHAIAPTVVKTLSAQYREFRGEVTIGLEELSSLREELRAIKAAASVAPVVKPPRCMVCGGAQRVRACAACLVEPAAKIERRFANGTEEVRFVLETPEGRDCVSDWTETHTASRRSDP